MKIRIESTEIIDNDFPKKDKQVGGRWYLRKQPFLLFKDGETYPDKGFITLVFTDNEQQRNNTQQMQKGEYQLLNSAFYINKNDELQVSFKPENFKLVKHVNAA